MRLMNLQNSGIMLVLGQYNSAIPRSQHFDLCVHIAMCLRVLRDALVSQQAVARYCKREGYG